MEWLEGEDLSHRLARGRLPLETTLLPSPGARPMRSRRRTRRGWSTATSSPATCSCRGHAIERVKLLDFGIAHGAHELVATLSGVVVGTPAYMAPEQARGAPDVDLRADLFSLGCVLFECLAGRPPFEGQHAMAVLAKILFEEAPTLRALRPDVPPALEGLVARMLAKDPAERPAGGRRGRRRHRGRGRREAPRRRARGADGPGAAAGQRHRRRIARFAGGRDGADRRVARQSGGAASARWAPFGARVEVLADGSVDGRGRGQRRRHRSGGARRALRAGDARVALAGLAGAGHRARGSWGRAAHRRGHRPGGLPAARGAARRQEHRRGGAHRARRGDGGAARRPLRARRRAAEVGAPGASACARPRPRRAACSASPARASGAIARFAALEAIFAECAAESVARAVLLTGPPGIGKSRVGHELLGRARAGAGRRPSGSARGDPMGAGSSWRLLAQMVTRAAGPRPAARPLARPAGEDPRVTPRAVLAGDDASRVAEFLGELTGAPFPDENRVQLRAARQDARLLGDQNPPRPRGSARGRVRAGPGAGGARGSALGRRALDRVLRRRPARPRRAAAHGPRRWPGPTCTIASPGCGTSRHAQEVRLAELSRKGERAAARARARRSRVARRRRAASSSQRRGQPVLPGGADPRLRRGPGRRAARHRARHGAGAPGGARARGSARAARGEHLRRGVLEPRACARCSETAPTRSRCLCCAGSWSGGRSSSAGARVASPGRKSTRSATPWCAKGAYGMLTDRDRVVGHGLAGAWLVEHGERDGDGAGRALRAAAPSRSAPRRGTSARPSRRSRPTISRPPSSPRARCWSCGAQGELLGAALLSRGRGAHSGAASSPRLARTPSRPSGSCPAGARRGSGPSTTWAGPPRASAISAPW